VERGDCVAKGWVVGSVPPRGRVYMEADDVH